MIGELRMDEIDDVLRSNVVGRIGCCDEKQVYVVPINYVFDGKYILGHSVAGKKIEMMRKNPNVCFEVDEMKTFTNWRSVIAWGRYQELTTERERYRAMKEFVARLMPLKISETALLPEIHEHRTHPRAAGNIRPIIYRIMLTTKTGRFESEGATR